MNKYVYEAMFRSLKIPFKVLMQLFDRSEIAGIRPMVMRCLMKRDVLHVSAALESFYKISTFPP